LNLLFGMRSAWLRFWSAFKHDTPQTPSHPSETAPGQPLPAGEPRSFEWREWRLEIALALAALALLLAAWMAWQRRYRRRTATASYARLRERLERSGV